jgi:hypothetical protein
MMQQALVGLGKPKIPSDRVPHNGFYCCESASRNFFGQLACAGPPQTFHAASSSSNNCQ